MSLRHIRDGSGRRAKSGRSKSPYLPTHGADQTSGYREYLAHGNEPKDKSRNPRNLFHELNNLDVKWFMKARLHLSRIR